MQEEGGSFSGKMSSGISEKKYRCGDIRESDGKIFLEYRRDYIRKNGERKIAERWVTPEVFAKKKKYKKEYRKRPYAIARNNEQSYIRKKKPEVKAKLKKYWHDYYRRPEVKARDRARVKHKMLTDPKFAIAKRVRARIKAALKRARISKKDKTETLIGCSYLFLKEHIEKQFRDGMGWDKPRSFHIDHIRPLSSFDLTNPEELKLACHWSNLQPLTPEENLSKGHKWDQEMALT